MSAIVLRRGLVMGAAADEVADVRISAGRIAEVAPALPVRRGDVDVDCDGCWVGPGFVDLHTHLREPGGEHKEDVTSGTVAAAAGGFTAVVAMPNTDPPLDSGDLIRRVAGLGDAAGHAHVFPAGALTEARAGLHPARFVEMFDAGARMFTDDGDTVADDGLLGSIMETLASLGGVVTQHAVDPEQASGGHMRLGEVSAALGIRGIPPAAEPAVVARDLELVRQTGAAYHLQHVSTAAAVDLLADAKEEGLPVTGEVTPHHLAFDDTVLADGPDTNYKMMPPLGSSEDVAALRRALRDGVIDVVATDHAPHAPFEKEVPFEEAPFGVIGLADAAAVVNDLLDLEPRVLFDRMSVTPARIASAKEHGRWLAPGVIANLVVFDPRGRDVPTRTFSRSTNSPFLGRARNGAVRFTLLRGAQTYSGGPALVGSGGKGG